MTSKHLGVVMAEKDKYKVKAAAQKLGISASELVRYAVFTFLKSKPKKDMFKRY